MSGARFSLTVHGRPARNASDKMMSDDLVSRIIAAAGKDAGVVALLWSGESKAEIARLYGVTSARIYQRLDRAKEQIWLAVPEMRDEIQEREGPGSKAHVCPGCGVYVEVVCRSPGWAYCSQCRHRGLKSST